MGKRRKHGKTTNRHHLIFQGQHYKTGYGKLLRDAFVYELDIKIHDELHHDVLHDVPKPPESQLKAAWEAYQAYKYIIDRYGIIRATEWLLWACDDPAWRACMKRQLEFLQSRLGK